MALYDAFISYSHAKDKPVAAALQSAIQRLGKPWYRRRALRVFRDDTSLAATPQLWPTIEQALGQSRFLILLASPEAAASRWVDKEIAFWLQNKSADTLLIGVTDGVLAWDYAAQDFAWSETTPLPPSLKGRFAAEPKWVDLAGYREGADKDGAKFTELAADFAAAIRGMPKEDLLSQEVRQQRRALALATTAAAALLVLAIDEASPASFWFDLGLARQDLQDLEGAAAAYRAALERQPTLAEAAVNLGVVLQEAGDLAGAMTAYGRAYRTRPSTFGMIAHALTSSPKGRLWLDPEALKRALGG